MEKAVGAVEHGRRVGLLVCSYFSCNRSLPFIFFMKRPRCLTHAQYHDVRESGVTHASILAGGPSLDTAHDIQSRMYASALRTGVPFLDEMNPRGGGLEPGGFVELAGRSGAAKSEACLCAVATCVLPRACGGHESSVAFFDNDRRLCVPRLMAILEHRLREAPLPACGGGDRSTESWWRSSDIPKPTAKIRMHACT